MITAFVTVLTVCLVLLAGLVLDGGNLLAAKRQAINEAEAAARAGAQALQPDTLRAGTVTIDPAAATTAVADYLTATGHHGTTDVTGDTVTVTITIHQHLAILGLGGLHDITVTGHGAARALRGVTRADT
jgi:Flp pilus assembly protein TadG